MTDVCSSDDIALSLNSNTDVCDFDLSTQNKWVPGLIAEHLDAKFGDPSCIGVRYIVWKDRQTNSGEKPTHMTTVGVGN